MKKIILLAVLSAWLLAVVPAYAGTEHDKAAVSDDVSSADVIPSLPSTVIPNDTPDNINTLDPMEYGAKADGITNDAAAIQQAIDRCAKSGGGIVVLKSGTFLSSPLVLKTGVYLKIEKLAMLKAVPFQAYPGAGGSPRPVNFLSARGAERFGVFGGGTIDGNGQDWWRTQGWQGEDLPKLKIPNHVSRPYLIYFTDSSDIIVKDVTIQNSPSFNLVPQSCDNVVISNVKIHNPANSHNTDGIDPAGTNIFIDGCSIDTGDDNIAIKATSCGTKNVYITNCTFYHGHGLSIGSDFPRGVQTVYVRNIAFENTETAIRIKSARDRGGFLDDVHYSHITMKNVGKAILITGYYPNIPLSGVDAAHNVTLTTPNYQNITISDIKATAKKSAGAIIGVPEKPVQDVTLTNVDISAPAGLTVRNAEVAAVHTEINVTDGPAYIEEEKQQYKVKLSIRK